MLDVSLERDLTAKFTGSWEESCNVFLCLSLNCRFDFSLRPFCMTTPPASPDMAESRTVLQYSLVKDALQMHYKDTKLHFMRNLPYLLLELLPVGHGNTHVYLRTILVAVEGA